MTVASMATRAVDSITPMRTGPRSDRKPTPDDAGTCSTLTAGRVVARWDDRAGPPRGSGAGQGVRRARRGPQRTSVVGVTISSRHLHMPSLDAATAWVNTEPLDPAGL